eukprot:UN34377
MGENGSATISLLSTLVSSLLSTLGSSDSLGSSGLFSDLTSVELSLSSFGGSEISGSLGLLFSIISDSFLYLQSVHLSECL